MEFDISGGVLVKYNGPGGHVVIPDGITSIGDRAFDKYTSLTSITIPPSVLSIGELAFVSCTGLTRVEIPASVTSIGYRAFSFCERLMYVSIASPDTSIGEGAFDKTGCKKVKAGKTTGGGCYTATVKRVLDALAGSLKTKRRR